MEWHLDFQWKFWDYTIGNVTNAVQAAGNPELEVLLVGRGPMGHSAEVLVGQSNRLLGTVEFNGYESFKFIQPIEWTDIAADGTLKVRIKVNGVWRHADRFSASYIKLRYPQSFDVNGVTEKTILIEPNAGGKSYIEIEQPVRGSFALRHHRS